MVSGENIDRLARKFSEGLWASPQIKSAYSRFELLLNPQRMNGVNHRPCMAGPRMIAARRTGPIKSSTSANLDRPSLILVISLDRGGSLLDAKKQGRVGSRCLNGAMGFEKRGTNLE